MPSEGVSKGLWPEHTTRDREQVFVLLEHDVQIHLRLRTPSSEDQGKRQRETGPWEPDQRSLHLTSKESRERASFRG